MENYNRLRRQVEIEGEEFQAIALWDSSQPLSRYKSPCRELQLSQIDLSHQVGGPPPWQLHEREPFILRGKGSHCRWTSLFMQKLLFKIAGTWFRKGGKSRSWFPAPSPSLSCTAIAIEDLDRIHYEGRKQWRAKKEGERKSEWDGDGLPGGINAM